MFFSLYQIFEDAIYGYTIILGPDHLDSLLLKKIELAKNIVKFFFGHIQKHKNLYHIFLRFLILNILIMIVDDQAL